MATGAGSVTIGASVNFQRIQTQIEAAVLAVVNSSAHRAYDVAQQRVPVRRIFKGGRRQFVTLPRVTMQNIEQAKVAGTPEHQAVQNALAAREISGMPLDATGKQTYYQPGRKIQTNRPWENRDFALPGKYGRKPGGAARAQRLDLRSQLLQPQLNRLGDYAFSLLSSKGRYELRTGRADYKGRVGGRLKGEMEVEEAKVGPHFRAEVSSPTYYAKYVEFGTRRAAAQPYLRPGLMAVSISYRDNMLSALQRAGRYGLESKRGAGGQVNVSAQRQAIGLDALSKQVGPILGPQPGQPGFTASQNEALSGYTHLIDVMRTRGGGYVK